MVRLHLAFALVCLLALPRLGAAQISDALAKSTPAERARIQTDVMKDKLGLTAEQVPKIEAINLDTAQKMEPILKGSEGQLVKLRHANQLEAAKESALQGVLTGDQYQKFLALRAEMKQKLEEKLKAKAASATP